MRDIAAIAVDLMALRKPGRKRKVVGGEEIAAFERVGNEAVERAGISQDIIALEEPHEAVTETVDAFEEDERLLAELL